MLKKIFKIIENFFHQYCKKVKHKYSSLNIVQFVPEFKEPALAIKLFVVFSQNLKNILYAEFIDSSTLISLDYFSRFIFANVIIDG